MIHLAVDDTKHSFLLRYTAVGYPDYVQYTALVDEIESIFTLKGMWSFPFLFVLGRITLYCGSTSLGSKPGRGIMF